MVKIWAIERKAWLALELKPLEFDHKEQIGYTTVQWKEVKGVKLEDDKTDVALESIKEAWRFISGIKKPLG